VDPARFKDFQVANFTTPANYFHALRRQVHRSINKPLIVMTPKSLLRHKLCVSTIGDFTQGGFRNVIDDAACDELEQVERVVLCTGKVYYELVAGREELGLKEVALVRVEQIYPFPKRELRAILARYTRAVEVCWVQEEARNMGAWNFVQPLLDEVLREEVELAYIGRDEAASPAVGVSQTHQDEQQEIVEQALNVQHNRLVLDLKQEDGIQGAGEQQVGTRE